MKRNLACFLMLFAAFAFGQDFSVTTVAPLDGALSETSGLILVDDRLITHKDSGDGPYLYEVDQVTGETTRTVVVANAASSDWEDICYDDTYIYIGDFGNNAGTRTDLRIFRITVSDYLTTPNDTVYCDTIAFSYADQVDFEPAVYTTNYDAEAFIAYNDSLYLFSKNWGNYETNVYSIPKDPGTYSVHIIDNFDTEGLVTGADYDADKNEIMLTGYTFTTPFLYLVKGFSGNDFSGADLMTRATPGFEGSIQIEGVAAQGGHTWYVSSEDHVTGASMLHEVVLSNFVGLDRNEADALSVYPNPVEDILYTNTTSNEVVILLSAKGDVVYKGNGNEHQLETLKAGNYWVIILDQHQKPIYSSQIVKY